MDVNINEYFTKHRIVEFENQKKTFELWKKYVTEDLILANVNNDRKNEKSSKVPVYIRDFEKYFFEWRKWNNPLVEETVDEIKTKENKINECLKKDKSEEQYVNEYEKLIEKANIDVDIISGESEKSPCVVTYDHYINRTAEITYDKEISFLHGFYSSMQIIKENRLIIPKGLYLYELIYPQTTDGFPIINEWNYYFVKLFINNKWMIVFTDLHLPFDKNQRMLSCSSSDSRELWVHILMSALFRCFQILHFDNYEYYILEMISGLKCWKKRFNRNKVLEGSRMNYLQCVLLQDKKYEETSTQNHHNSNYISKVGRFYFMLCSDYESHIGIQCGSIVPMDSIPYQNSKIEKRTNRIPKGYKYLNEEGKIKFRKTQLMPAHDECSIDKNNNDNEKKMEDEEISIKINENVSKKLCLFKEKLKPEGNKKSKGGKTEHAEHRNEKSTHGKENQKMNKDFSTQWLNESEIEKIQNQFRLTYSNDYLIQKNFLEKKMICTFMNPNKLTFVSLQECIAGGLFGLSKQLKNSKGDKMKRNHKTEKGDKVIKGIDNNSSSSVIHFPYVFLICIISPETTEALSTHCSDTSKSKLKKSNKSLKKIKSMYEDIKNGKDTEEKEFKSKHDEKSLGNIEEIEKTNVQEEKEKEKEFYITFFPFKEREEKERKQKEQKKKTPKKRNDENYDILRIKASQIKMKKIEKKNCFTNVYKKNYKKRKNILKQNHFIRDFLEYNCFFKQICSYDYSALEPPNFLQFQNLFYEILSNSYDNYVFKNYIKRRSIVLEKCKEHIYLLYIKNITNSNFFIEWMHGDLYNQDHSFNICTFMTIEEFLEKKGKMNVSSLEKSLTIKKDTLSKVLFKFMVDVSFEINSHSFFYLLYKTSDISFLQNLYLYICRIEKGSFRSDKKGSNERRKSHDQTKSTEDVYRIVGPFHKVSFEELFLRIQIPENLKEASYLFLVVFKQISSFEKKIDSYVNTNLHFNISVAVPSQRTEANEKGPEKKKNSVCINELSSFCKRYILSKSEIMQLMKQHLLKRQNKENKKGGIHRKTITIVKKISVHSKKEYVSGSFYFNLNNCNIFNYIRVQITKVIKKKKEEDHEGLRFLANRYQEELQMEKTRKKNIFFKHIRLFTNELYLIRIQLQKNSQRNLKKRVQEEIRNNSEEETEEDTIPNISLDIHWNFTDEISLQEDPSNENFEKEVKKYIEANKINMEEKQKQCTERKLSNLFDFNNELLLHAKDTFERIFKNILQEKRQIGYTTPNNRNINEQPYDTIVKEEEHEQESILYKTDFYNSTLFKKINIDQDSLDSIFSKYFENTNNEITKSTFIKVLTNLQNEDSFLQISKFDKFEKHPLTFNLDKNSNIKVYAESDKKSSSGSKKKKNAANSESGKSGENIFSFLSNIQDIINEIKNDSNLKNKIDPLKIKMDAEFHITESSLSLLKQTNPYTKIVTNNYHRWKELNKKRELSEKESMKVEPISKKGENLSIIKEGTLVKNEKSSKINCEHTNSSNTQFHKCIPIEPEIGNIQDLLNAVKKIDSHLESDNNNNNNIQNVKNELSKLMKERRTFTQSINNNIKNKKFKNFKLEELKELHKKALDLHLDLYNNSLVEYLNNYCIVLENLDTIKSLFKLNELKKSKLKNNDSFNIEDFITDKFLFFELFEKYINISNMNESIQLNDHYKKIGSDAQILFNKATNTK